MQSAQLVDRAGRSRSPATVPGYHRGRPPRNKGLRYPADPPTVEEIIAVMRAAGDHTDGVRLRGLIVVLWRAGLPISEALALADSDLDPARGAILLRQGKGGKRRKVGMGRWAWDQLDPWLQVRVSLPVGALFCVLRGPTRGQPCSPAAIRSCTTPRSRPGFAGGLRPISCDMRTRSRCRARACRCWSSKDSSGMPISRSHPCTCAGVDNTEIVDTVHERPAPMIPASNGLRPKA